MRERGFVAEGVPWDQGQGGVGDYVALLRSQPWMSRAECATADPAVFFDQRRVGEARAICARCPVLAECRAWNDKVESVGAGARGGTAYLLGVFAAETPSERVARRQEGGGGVARTRTRATDTPLLSASDTGAQERGTP